MTGAARLAFFIRAPNASRALQVRLASTDPIAMANTRAAEQLGADPGDTVLLAPNGREVPLSSMAADVAASVTHMT
eukprot:3506773-Alexandrium_andersonii.AAC.1